MKSGVNRDEHQEADGAGEPLIDINVEPASPGEAMPQVLGRRRRLSDVLGGDDSLQTRSRRPPLHPAHDEGRGAALPRMPAPACADPMDVQAPTATLEPPETAHEVPLEEPTVESAAPPSSPSEPTGLHTGWTLAATVGGGLLAAVVGALVWAAVTAVTGVPVTWMAIGVGLLIASTIRMVGRSPDRSLGRLAAGLSLFACLLGNCLANGALVARDIGLSAASVLIQISPGTVPKLIVATFHPLDLLFYGLAVCLCYRCSFSPSRRTD